MSMIFSYRTTTKDKLKILHAAVKNIGQWT